MLRKIPQYDSDIYLRDLLTPDEIKLLGVPGEQVGWAFREYEDFRRNAWDLYGPSWPDHVPHPDINPYNAAMQYLFGRVCWWYQLWKAWTPYRIMDTQIIGARGTGKTSMVALINGLFLGIHPGNNGLHVAPSKDQADKVHAIVLEHGQHDHAEARDFVGLFLSWQRKAPFSYFRFRPWDEHDPGTEWWFRSFGKPNEPGELVRSHEAALLSADEAFRTFQTDWALRVITGCMRGLNGWKVRQNPDAFAEWNKLSMKLSTTFDLGEREALEDQIDKLAREHDLERQVELWVMGNAGWEAWSYQRAEWAAKNPGDRYAITWETDWNPAYSRRQRKALSQQFIDDPEGFEMETKGKRPPPPGDIYTQQQIADLFSGEMDVELIQAVADGKPGYSRKVHDSYGVYQFMIPPVMGRVYAGGADAGTQQMPGRGKWTILLADITERPFRIVYFEMGQETRFGTGSIKPWAKRLKWLVKTYPILPLHLYVDATGIQQSLIELIWEDIPAAIYGFDMTMKKGLILKSQLMLAADPLKGHEHGGLFRSPHVAQWEREMGIYTLPDTAPLAQDIAMAFLALCASTWDQKGEDLGLKLDVDNYEAKAGQEIARLEHIQAYNREVRLAGREIRSR